MAQRLLWRAKAKGFDPSGPHALPGIVDHVTLAGSNIQLVVTTVVVDPVSVSGYAGAYAQLTATALDQLGNVVLGKGVTWTSANTAVARVDQNGLVTFVANGTTTVTATVDGRAYAVSVTTQAKDGSYADVITACLSDAITIRKFRDARLAVSDGVGVQTIPCVPGVTGPALKVYENGGANIHRPSIVNGTVRTGGLGGLVTFASENWNGDASTDLSVGVWKLFFGAFVTAGSGTACAGIQHASDRVGEAILQGGFDSSPQTVDAFFYTDGNPSSSPHSYFWQTKYPLGTTNCGTLAWFIPKGSGTDGDLNATPWAKTIRIGVEGPRTLPHGQVSANQYTAFPSGPCRDFYGPEPSGTVGSPVIGSTVDVIFASDIEFGSAPTPGVLQAWQRYVASHPAYVAPTQVAESYVACGPADSRGRGNGASDLAHAIPGQLGTILGPLWQTDNLGISGDGWDNAILQPYVTHRLAGIYDANRTWNVLKIGPQGVNSFNGGMSAATALARLDTLIAIVRTLYTSGQVPIMVALETTQAGGEAQATAYNDGVLLRHRQGMVQIVSRPDRRWELQDPINSTYWTDGLHNTDAGYLVYAQEDAEALAAHGADGILQGISFSPGTQISVATGANSQLTATLLNDRGSTVTGYTFTWSSSNTGKATVDSTGLVHGVAAGSCVVTATTANGTLQMQCRVTVT